MTQTVHIFIATTKGLVAVQNITDLRDSDLQSVITVNGSSDMASISVAYHRFVQKNTGIIQNAFGGDAYRVNISGNIDQGSSWQLAMYAAHWINANASAFKLGNGIVEKDDIVLCLTGQVNTSSGSVEQVSAVAEKMLKADATVRLWARKGALVEFIYPLANSMAHLPELACTVHSCSNIEELISHLAHLLSYQPSTNIVSPEVNPDVFEKAVVNTTSANVQKANRIKLPLVWLVMGCIVLLAVGLYTALQHNSGEAVDTMDIQLSYKVTTRVGSQCDVNAIDSINELNRQFVAQIPAANIDEICQLSLLSNNDLPQVWMISDSKTIMELRSSETKDGQLWHINLPRFQQRQRQFILVITAQRLDLADLASLTDFLSRLPRNESVSVESLAEFFSAVNINPRYVSQTLLVD